MSENYAVMKQMRAGLQRVIDSLDILISYKGDTAIPNYQSERNGASVEACEQEEYFCPNIRVNTNEQSDKCEREKFNNACGYTQVDWEADKNKLQWEFEIWNRALQNCAEECSKTERCELEREEVRDILEDLIWAKGREDGSAVIGGLLEATDKICSHFTAPNVKDNRDKLIIAMKEEILILRANVKQLEDEQQKKCLSVDETYQFMCDHIEWQGNNAPNLRKLAEQLHQRIYEHKES